jgi:hypothetical protein
VDDSGAIANFGYYLGGLGDVNGDGLGDFIVQNLAFDSTGVFDPYASAWIGSGMEPGTTTAAGSSTVRFMDSRERATAAGDVNGDGIPDILASDHTLDIGDGETPGTVFVYLTPASVLEP